MAANARGFGRQKLGDWDSIDIFVFSNGQQYSPPRKYHLESDYLKCWEATKSFLARSQYGSKHSVVDLYLLDGKKVEGPLELKNSAAYVAVEPPDSFIPAGYEKYLYKASRSWEKRQGKLSNSYIVERTDKTGTFLDITTLEQIERIVSLKSDSSKADSNKADNQSQRTVERPTFSKLNSPNIDRLYQKKKSSDNERNSSLSKKRLSPSKLAKNDFVKTKNNLRSQKHVTKPLSPQYSRNQRKLIRGNRVENKVNPKRNNFHAPETENNAKLNNIFNNTNVENNIFENIPNKDLRNGSQVYKNNESDEKSVLLVANPNNITTDGNTTKKIFEVSKDNANDDVLIPRDTGNAKSIHITGEKTNLLPLENNKQNLNIKLRIKLENLRSPLLPEDGNTLEKNRSLITLIKKEMASQVNIDVILDKDILNLNNYLFLNGKSKESNINKHEESVPCNDDLKDIFVHCTYDNFYPKLIKKDSHRQNIFILPKEISEHLMKSSCKCDHKNVEKFDKGIQKSLSSSGDDGLHSSKIDKNKIDIPTKTNFQSELQGDVNIVDTNVPTLMPKTFDEKSTQTEWCNIVLQAKIHEEGRYSFHLPALSLLKQYNINQI
ncbi:putative uncharacterized protein DDB_G0282499 [Vanessa cardui]|uniref:putative uncharacterized protein DDB_G0282499 n=1 Tax=Vanessa cardui TaxID=171605 RepID=UPI001F12F7A0|nr:putative uncharacterized protein DDB_G0282499 [Vanessa cardui]